MNKLCKKCSKEIQEYECNHFECNHFCNECFELLKKSKIEERSELNNKSEIINSKKMNQKDNLIKEYKNCDLYIDYSNLLLPNKYYRVIEIALFIISTIMAVLYLGTMFFIYSIVFYLVMYIILGKIGVILIPQVKYNCPKCNLVYEVTISKKQKNYLINHEKYKCKCKKCNYKYNLHVSKDVLDHF
jgi:hypothetical protein